MKTEDDNFINIKFNDKNLNIYFVRKSIFTALKENLKYFKGELLDVGYGKMPYKKYILENSKVSKYTSIDIENCIIYDENIKPDLFWDGKTLPLKNESIDTILGTELLEHCPYPEIIFNEFFRVLKKGGTIFLTTPFIFPLHESPYDEYRYTPYSIKRFAQKVGFKDIIIKPLGGIQATLAQILAIYPTNKYIRFFILLPLVYILIHTDKKLDLKDGSMFTGLSTLIKK